MDSRDIIALGERARHGYCEGVCVRYRSVIGDIIFGELENVCFHGYCECDINEDLINGNLKDVRFHGYCDY